MKPSVIISIDRYLPKRGLNAIVEEHEDFILINQDNQKNIGWKEKVMLFQPNIFIIDYQEAKKDFSESLVQIQDLTSKTSVLVISADEDPVRIKQVFDSGIMGFLTLHCSANEIETALSSISNGNRFFCQEIISLLFSEQKSNNQLKSDGLSAREIEVLELIGKGSTSKQIAESLFVSIHTVNSHRKSLLKKLNMKSPAQLIAYALDKF